MVIPETIVASVTLGILGLLLVLSLRFRLKERVVFHLTLYNALAFVSNLLILMALLEVDLSTTTFNYDLSAEFTLLAMIAAFGGLILSFLKVGQLSLVSYWATALLLFAVWSAFAVNFKDSADQAIDYLATWGLDIGTHARLIVLVAGLGWIASIITTLISLTLGFKKPQPTQYLNRLRYWLIVTTLLSITGLSFFISPMVRFYTGGLSLLTMAAILATYNVLSYRTPDLKLLVGWGLHHIGMITILSSVALLAFITAIQLYVSLPTSINLWLWLTTLAALLASAYRPLIRGLNQLLTKIIFGRTRHDEKQMIKRYSQSISSTLDLQRLSDVTVALMTETLEIERSVVFVNEQERSGSVSLRPYSVAGINEWTPRRFTIESPFIKYFLEKGTILSQYDINVHPDFSSLVEAERKWLANLGIELYVPVLREQELLAVLAFGPHSQGTTYNQEEQDLMMMLADQAGMAFEGALLFQQLATVNEEVGMLTDRLSVLDQSKADFLSIASHELRTPLTQIHTYSQLLLEFTEEDLKDETYVQTVFEGIARGSERMKEVVDMMLDVSAADLGKMHLFSGPVILKQVYEQAIQPFIPVLGERRIKLDHTGLTDLPLVEADGTRLVQVLENLIGNAIKYTPDGGEVLVRGRTIVDGNAGPAIEIAVIDRGIGINPEHQQMIFEKFFRVDDSKNHSTSKTKFKGAGPGLGLPLVKAIVEAHRGRVWVNSLGHDEKSCPGSTFCFTLPLPIDITEELETKVAATRVQAQAVSV